MTYEEWLVKSATICAKNKLIEGAFFLVDGPNKPAVATSFASFSTMYLDRFFEDGYGYHTKQHDTINTVSVEFTDKFRKLIELAR
ncbi:MAG: hypothetical protein QW318_07705 [Candidatus Caldarchaeum sp.]